MTLSTSAAARNRARSRWQVLADRIRTVSPEAVGRGGLGTLVAVVTTWLAIASWPALAPFVAGVILAYAVLPIANRLDRVMPRVLAALLAEAVALGVLLGAIVVIVPPLLGGIVKVALLLPTPDQVQAGLASLQDQLGNLPEPIRGIVLSVATQSVANLQGVLEGMVNGAATFVTAQILGVAGTASFLLGLLVIPVWVLTLVSDERQIKTSGIRLIAPALRPDVQALFRIVDRALSTFLRIRVLLAVVAGALVWLGLSVARELGIAEFPFAVSAATLLGLLQLVPELGFFLGFFPILLVLVIGGPIPALTSAVVYVLAVRIASGLVETRVSRGVLDVHPALLIPAIVVLSQFGPLWFLAAAPVVAITRDLVRYIGGRLADPPAPAGAIPGERPRAPGAATTAAAVPTVYRARVARQAASTAAGPSTVASVADRPSAGTVTQRSAQS